MSRKPRKYTDEQIVSILQEHQGGVTAKEIIRRHGIALDTFYRWKRKYTGLGKAELQRSNVPTIAAYHFIAYQVGR